MSILRQLFVTKENVVHKIQKPKILEYNKCCAVHVLINFACKLNSKLNATDGIVNLFCIVACVHFKALRL